METQSEIPTIESRYKKLQHIDHILLRPDTYIGSVIPEECEQWVSSGIGTPGTCIVKKTISYVAGLYKLYDEILVNARDHHVNDSSVKRIDIVVDTASGKISISNDGTGLPVVLHKEHNVYVPELVFGHLLSSTNYDDTVQKTTGGRNGYGAKLANVFSRRFCVETVDDKHCYSQVFENNMRKIHPPTVTVRKQQKQGTCITFFPELARFGVSCIDDGMLALFHKRACDIAALTGLRVSFNNQQIQVKNFKQYCSLYLQREAPLSATNDSPLQENASCSSMVVDQPAREEEGDYDTDYLEIAQIVPTSAKTPLPILSAPTRPKILTEQPLVYEKLSDRWEVGVTYSPDGIFTQVSFVNGICTSRSGTHVKYIAKQICDAMVKKLSSKKQKQKITNAMIERNLWLFVNATVVNPSFDTQTKETLTTNSKQFGSEKVQIPATLVQKMTRCTPLMDAILGTLDQAQARDLKRSDGTKKKRITGIPKLDDANDAGGRFSKECTLILTEGDSAKALAVAGLSVIGRDRYGIYPLRGKLLNVRDASITQIRDNAELNALKEILGLKQGVKYTEETVKQLRYGHIMIMTDQDYDGFHICGLVINWLHYFWPELVHLPNFVDRFITRIYSVKRGKREHSFYSVAAYQQWRAENDNGKGWTVKVYKGLGTSTAVEAKQYFADINTHHVRFTYKGTTDDDAIELAFGKDKKDAANRRKRWLLDTYDPTIQLQYTHQNGLKTLSYQDFVNQELIHFSMADVIRSIPSIMDGLKPSQRKVLYSAFKRNLLGEIKVAQFAGYVAEHTSYHHGEASLAATIVNMAQDHVGSNNINFLNPIGQFGTRLQGGKDHASVRYVFTNLNSITRKIFDARDDGLLSYLDDDGMSIEPMYYVPVIPTLLVNGAEGIGTGWSTEVPCFNPIDIINNIRCLLSNQPTIPMTPWYRGFRGKIVKETDFQTVLADCHALFTRDTVAPKQTITATKSEDAKKYKTVGCISLNSAKTTESIVVLDITELPIGTWTDHYLEFLESLLLTGAERRKKRQEVSGGKNTKNDEEREETESVSSSTNSLKGKSGDAKNARKRVDFKIEDYVKFHTDVTVHFRVTLTRQNLEIAMSHKQGLPGAFRLVTTLSLNNLHLFNAKNAITKYETVEDIMREHFAVRLEYYEKRKQRQVSILTREVKRLENKVRLLHMVLNNELVLFRRPRAEVLEDLRRLGFLTESQLGDETVESEFEERGYDYLMCMDLWSLTSENHQRYIEAMQKRRNELLILQETDERKMWSQDLDSVEAAYNIILTEPSTKKNTNRKRTISQVEYL